MFEYKTLQVEPSIYNKYPTETNPHNRYKFTGIDITASSDQTIIARETYSGLDYLGDLGGLVDAFIILGNIFISPVAGFALNARLLSSIFKSQETQSEKAKTFTDSSDIQKDFHQELKPILNLNYWVATFCFKNKYKKLMEKSQN